MTTNAEKDLVAGLIAWPNYVPDVAAKINADDFENQDARAMFEAVLDLHRSGTPFDGDTGGVIEAAGLQVSTDLVWLAPEGFTTGYDRLANAVKAAAVKRAMAHTVGELKAVCDGELEADAERLTRQLKALQEHVDALSAASLRFQTPTIAEIAPPAIAALDRRSRGEDPPIETPWQGVNTALMGGLRGNTLNVLIGGTGAGKSQWAIQASLEAARKGIPVVYVGLELGGQDLFCRVLGLEMDKPWSELWRGMHTIEAARMTSCLSEIPFHVEVVPPNGYSYDQLYPLARAIRERYRDAKMPFIMVVDYLQLISSPRGTREDVRARVGGASYAMRAIARDLGGIVLCISSTSRSNYESLARSNTKNPWEMPAASFVGSGKEAGEIEFAADNVFVLASDQENETVHFGIAKQRAGRTTPSGDWIAMGFKSGKRFKELDEPPPPASSNRSTTGIKV